MTHWLQNNINYDADPNFFVTFLLYIVYILKISTILHCITH